MDDPSHSRTESGIAESEWAQKANAAARRAWLRRMLILLVGCCVGFALTLLWFSRLSTSLAIRVADSEAASLVRQHFAALESGDYRAAYEQLSARYRREMPFDLFEEMVAGHWPMMQGRVTLRPESATPDRVVLQAAFEPMGETSLRAEFTLVRANGRWWIDNVTWTQARGVPLIQV